SHSGTACPVGDFKTSHINMLGPTQVKNGTQTITAVQLRFGGAVRVIFAQYLCMLARGSRRNRRVKATSIVPLAISPSVGASAGIVFISDSIWTLAKNNGIAT